MAELSESVKQVRRWGALGVVPWTQELVLQDGQSSGKAEGLDRINAPKNLGKFTTQIKKFIQKTMLNDAYDMIQHGKYLSELRTSLG